MASALDAVAGVGRVTKHVLLKRCGHVHLVEACETWSKQSKRYLGKKRALSCTFTNERLEEFTPKPDSYDLIWVQWTMQYLIDQDVIRTLKALKVSFFYFLDNAACLSFNTKYHWFCTENSRRCCCAGCPKTATEGLAPPAAWLRQAAP